MGGTDDEGGDGRGEESLGIGEAEGEELKMVKQI